MPIGYTKLKFPDSFFDVFAYPDYQHSISIKDASEKEQIKYLERYLSDIGCVSILLELDYVDHDYLDDFANYYVKCFTPYKRYCRRAHFWSINIFDVDIEKAILENDESVLEDIAHSYLGFIVIYTNDKTCSKSRIECGTNLLCNFGSWINTGSATNQ